MVFSAYHHEGHLLHVGVSERCCGFCCVFVLHFLCRRISSVEAAKEHIMCVCCASCSRCVVAVVVAVVVVDCGVVSSISLRKQQDFRTIYMSMSMRVATATETTATAQVYCGSTSCNLFVIKVRQYKEKVVVYGFFCLWWFWLLLLLLLCCGFANKSINDVHFTRVEVSLSWLV